MSHERRIFLDNIPHNTHKNDPLTSSLYIPSLSIPSSQARYHYLVKVLRVKQNSELTVVCKTSNQEFLASVESIDGNKITLRINSKIEKRSTKSTDSPVDSLLFALCKGDTNDLVCEKATELGINNIILWKAERSIPILNNSGRENKLKRWNKIIETSAAQSGRNSLPSLHISESLVEAINLIQNLNGTESTNFYCSLEPGSQLVSMLKLKTSQASVVIGPEGDFTQNEFDLLKQHMYIPISLGNNRLRSETAAIVGIAMLQAVIPARRSCPGALPLSV